MSKKFISLILLLSCTSPCFGFDLKGISPVNPLDSAENRVIQKGIVIPSFELKKATLTKNSVKNQYAIAMDKFIKSNVRSSYADFRVLIDSVSPNDYVYMKLTEEMASIGFFNLAELSMSKISDSSLSALLEEDVKNFYFPSSVLTQKDQLYLAEMYSNIMYNDQSREATSELGKQTSLLMESDYANYIAAFGSMKNGDIKQAKEYINKAVEKNPKNINYKRLKAEILAQSSNPKDGINALSAVNDSCVRTVMFDSELHSSKEYTYYKAAKNDYLKKYHLAHYYYNKGELHKALGVLQTSISGKKNINKDVFALSAKVYFDMKEFEKAQDYANKSLDIDKNDVESLIILGDIETRNKNYNNAMKYYKKAQSKDKTFEADIKLAKLYVTLKEIQKAKDIYSKILKVSSKAYKVYYEMALLEPDREIEYLKKAISINPDFKDAWIDLARVEIKRNRLDMALSFLGAAKYMDDSDYRYYYYMGLIFKNKGLIAQANENFEQSLKLNPEYDLAKKELSI